VTFITVFLTLACQSVDLLDVCVVRQGDSTSVQLNPSIYPVLLILGRLCPSVAEGFNSSLRLEELVPFIIRLVRETFFSDINEKSLLVVIVTVSSELLAGIIGVTEQLRAAASNLSSVV